jgi:hypothetical protein
LKKKTETATKKNVNDGENFVSKKTKKTQEVITETEVTEPIEETPTEQSKNDKDETKQLSEIEFMRLCLSQMKMS